MIVAVSGASGLIGRCLCRRLSEQGGTVQRIVRGAAGAEDIGWDPARKTIDRERLAGAEVVVHLAGEPLASGRWTAAKKRRIVDSRVQGTRLLAETLASLPIRPRVLLSASAIGIYGALREGLMEETSAPGNGFLAEVCRQWEAAAQPAADAGIRVVLLRIGVVLDPAGGALRSMLPMFRLGLGGRLGSGRQWLSWITLADTVRAIEHVMEREDVKGPVNIVAPGPVTNMDFARCLGEALHRPAGLPVPAFALRLLVGEMAEEAVLGGTAAVPSKLLRSGFTFEYPGLPGALQSMLGGKTPLRG